MRALGLVLAEGGSHHCLHCSHTCECTAVLSWSVNVMFCVGRAHLQPKRWLPAEKSSTPVLAASVQTPRHSPRCVFTARMTFRPRQAPKRCIDVSTQVRACVVVYYASFSLPT